MEVWELKLYFYPSAGGLKKKEKKKDIACTSSSGFDNADTASTCSIWGGCNGDTASTASISVVRTAHAASARSTTYCVLRKKHPQMLPGMGVGYCEFGVLYCGYCPYLKYFGVRCCGHCRSSPPFGWVTSTGSILVFCTADTASTVSISAVRYCTYCA